MKRLIATLASAGLLLALPTAAPAATTCDFGSGLLEVQLPAYADVAALSVADGGEIQVRDNAGVVVPCGGTGGPPSVSNVNVISIVNAPTAGDNDVRIRGPSRFAPGASTVGENGGTPEIEISVNLNNRDSSSLTVGSETLGVPIRFGTSGINTNAVPGEVAPDVDIFPTQVTDLAGSADTSVGTTVSAEGGAGTGDPLTVPILLYGGSGADLLVGGEGADTLFGNDASDTLRGNGGDDILQPGADLFSGPGDDIMDGGPGDDEVRYSAAAGVTVDLAVAGPQNTGAAGSDTLVGVENITGTSFDDVLRGDDQANTLFGIQGADVLEGRGGVDVLHGGPGADSLFVRDGGPDTAACGPELDMVTVDPPGLDAVIDCDTVLFPEVPGTEPPGGGGGPDVPGGAAGRCAGKRATITGTDAGETIRGTRRRDVIDARGGNDGVKGLGGNDVLCGGTGNDELSGGDGDDELSGAAGSDELLGGHGRDRLSGGTGRDRLSGGTGRDSLLGGSGRDRLSGGSGNDRLAGGAGRDKLLGGPGMDSRR